MDDLAAVILAAGRGTRMRSSLPKVLHTVCGKPMVSHVVDAVRAVHSGRLVVVASPESDALRQCAGDSAEFVVQAQPRGTADALLQAENLLRDRAAQVMVLCGDTPLILSSSLSRLLERHQATGATVTLLTSDSVPPEGLGRIVRDGSGRVVDVVEDADAGERESAIAEVNAGVYLFRAEWLWPALRELSPSATGEYYLTNLIKMASGAGLGVESVGSEGALEILGVNTRVQLAQAEQAMRQRILTNWMLAGVTIVDPATTYIEAEVTVGQDTTVYPNTTLAGRTRVGERCALGPGSMIYDSVIGDGCKIIASMLEGAHLDASVEVGPFSHLRPGTVIEEEVHIGNYAEVKNSRVGRGTKMGHFSYVGDADVGHDVNIGAGAITCNFDGVNKNRTVIGDNAFIGSDTMLVAPVRVGARSSTGAGSVVTRDVPPDSLVVGAPARAVRKKRAPEQTE
ncbi:MAG: bifunctional UDP-N-acetylglucosamine diphosphorylase/glucosamine-1-phosphate N-acetyltransferase GlmU [Dehalococcoidia bacterium]|nr:bifunctional UDP-N-acetylglucosamine diphosphorylase/glucosamine-1-phosphate N-acetyltransferase GlmU [Dehalococcoidia bacterium]